MDVNLFPMSSGVSEWASDRMSAAERASEVSGTRNEQMEERMAQHSSISYAFYPMCIGPFVSLSMIRFLDAKKKTGF